MKGRPFKSNTRQNIEKILATMGMGYGYLVYKIYRKAYEKTSLRNIYYHLHTGVKLGEFIEIGSEEGKGDYTWGGKTERKIYTRGPNASQEKDPKAEEVMKELSIAYKNPEKKIPWSDIAKRSWSLFSNDLKKAKSQQDKRRLMEEYGRIRAWLGKHDNPKEREKIEKKLNSLI